MQCIFNFITIIISIVSLYIAIRAMLLARTTFLVNLKEIWIEKIAYEIKSKLPTNNISISAGITVARLIDSLPKDLIG